MRPRRPRLPRPIGGIPPASPRRPVHPRLLEAHHLMENGNYLAAAEIFEKLALRARGFRAQRTPFILFQAGRARLLGGEENEGLNLLQQGLLLLKKQERWSEIKAAAGRINRELQQSTSPEIAQAMQDWLKQQFPDLPEQQEEKTFRPVMLKGHLPVKCPSCGAAVHPDEVTWTMEGMAALCSYCGNVLREETE